jgi:hypothetical protein
MENLLDVLIIGGGPIGKLIDEKAKLFLSENLMELKDTKYPDDI